MSRMDIFLHSCTIQAPGEYRAKRRHHKRKKKISSLSLLPRSLSPLPTHPSRTDCYSCIHPWPWLPTAPAQGPGATDPIRLPRVSLFRLPALRPPSIFRIDPTSSPLLPISSSTPTLQKQTISDNTAGFGSSNWLLKFATNKTFQNSSVAVFRSPLAH